MLFVKEIATSEALIGSAINFDVERLKNGIGRVVDRFIDPDEELQPISAPRSASSAPSALKTGCSLSYGRDVS
jgi:hypothetical protein